MLPFFFDDILNTQEPNLTMHSYAACLKVPQGGIDSSIFGIAGNRPIFGHKTSITSEPTVEAKSLEKMAPNLSQLLGLAASLRRRCVHCWIQANDR